MKRLLILFILILFFTDAQKTSLAILSEGIGFDVPLSEHIYLIQG
jgi:hypothetical protein|tara:strand:+ start:1108 stop:1242 length:135 start_codon:yes stop_codon:yes gene_type:complete